MARQLLVPVDGSPLADRALEHAFEAYEDPAVVALHVIDPGDPGYSTSTSIDVDVRTEPAHGTEEWYDRAEAEEEQVFESARELAGEYDAELSTDSAVGEPAREIVDYAQDNDIDAIVMGSHGRTGPTRLLLGSTAELVVGRAPVTVTVVRDEL